MNAILGGVNGCHKSTISYGSAIYQTYWFKQRRKWFNFVQLFFKLKISIVPYLIEKTPGNLQFRGISYKERALAFLVFQICWVVISIRFLIIHFSVVL